MKTDLEPTPTPPIAPSLEEWAQLDPAARARLAERLTWETDTATSAEALRLAEGDAHQDACSEAKETLRLYFGGRRNRSLYIASNMSVIYPSQTGFAPDILAVLDVDPHPRDSWLVHVEGKGIDLAMEFCKEGDRRKDFETNVQRYAGLGITEYFAVDLKRGYLRAWRLPSAAARSYKPILAQVGRYRSEVLDLDLAFIDGTLRFFSDNALLQSRKGMIQFLEHQVDEERTRTEEERTRADEERTRADEERTRACAALTEAVLLVLKLRAIPLSEAQRQHVTECQDLAQLQRWLAHAAEAPDATLLLADG